jgi:hypothetical protein
MRQATAAFLLSVIAAAVSACAQPATPSPVNELSALPDVTPRAVTPTSIQAAAGGRPASGGVVYVTSQGLYFDTFVARDPLPMHGKFQALVNGTTEFGPGDPGYLGGRWWEDSNANGMQDEGDHFFLCPLLGPGRPTP